MSENQSPMFPMIMMPPWMNNSPQPIRTERPPARILVALDFLAGLSVKTMTRAAVNNVGIEQIDGQKLSATEVDAQNAACEMLENYFLGKLQPDFWEKKQAENGVLSDKPGLVMQCPACIGRPMGIKPDCKICAGEGQILTFPTSGSES